MKAVTKHWLLLVILPMLVITFFYVLPVSNLVRISFAKYDPSVGVIPEYYLSNYISLATDRFFWEVMWRTVKCSILVTIACILFGFPIATYIVSARGWRQTVLFIVLLMPLVTSVTVMSYGWLILLGRNGAVNQVLEMLHLIDAPLRLMQNETAIVVGLVHILIVFMVISISASLQSINPALVLASRSLGAGPWVAFRTIILPLSLPGLKSGSLLVFALSMSAYATPALLGGARNKFLSYLVYQQSVSLYNWPMGAAMAVVLLFATTLLIIALTMIARFWARRAENRALNAVEMGFSKQGEVA